MKGGIRTGGDNHTPHHTHGSSGADFRHRHQVPQQGSSLTPSGFNPVEVANLKHYLSGIDGKGDHECK